MRNVIGSRILGRASVKPPVRRFPIKIRSQMGNQADPTRRTRVKLVMSGRKMPKVKNRFKGNPAKKKHETPKHRLSCTKSYWGRAPAGTMLPLARALPIRRRHSLAVKKSCTRKMCGCLLRSNSAGAAVGGQRLGQCPGNTLGGNHQEPWRLRK